MKKTIAAVALSLAALAGTAQAGTIRHDVNDSVYRQIGRLPQFNSVGAILFDTPAGGYICSGTVIDAHWVLTAAHCVDEAVSMDFYEWNGTNHVLRQATSWFAHENWTGNLLQGWDVGLMYFEDALSVGPAQLYAGRNEFLATTTHVGYGASGTGITGSVINAGTRRGGQNMVDDLWSTQGDGQQLLWSDFDHPTDASYNWLDFVGYTFDDLAIPYEYSIAGGDSGGGAFIYENGQWWLAGVHSLGININGGAQAQYGDGFASTRVSSLRRWIEINAEIPEPESLALFGLASGLMLLSFRRKSRQG